MKHKHIGSILIISLLLSLLYVGSFFINQKFSSYFEKNTTYDSVTIYNSLGGVESIKTTSHPSTSAKVLMITQFVLSFPLIVISFVPGLRILANLSMYIFLLGPLLIFIGWTTILYLVMFVVSIFKRKFISSTE